MKKLKDIDWNKPIICKDGTLAEYKRHDPNIIFHGAGNMVVVGRINTSGPLWHEAIWDTYGRYIGSDNEPLDEFRLNVVQHGN